MAPWSRRRGAGIVEGLARDLRFGARMLGKDPGFTAAAVLTLALGIGANTAIFTAVDSLLLRRLPVADSDRLVFNIAMREGHDPFGSSLLDFVAYRDRNHSFTACGLAAPRSFNLTGREDPERVQGAAVQAELFTTLGIQPLLGRGITAADDRPGGPLVALVGHGFWRRRFGGDPRLLGQTLQLNGRGTTVVGILPEGFDYPGGAQVWIPLQARVYGVPLADLAAHGYMMVARLRPGVRLEQADEDLKTIAGRLEQEFPQVRKGWSVKVIPLRQHLLGGLASRVETSLLALLGAVGFLLLICCANAAGLLLARGVTREREIAVRRALGAGWWRVVRQLVAESLLLAALGGLGGGLLALAILPVLGAENPIQTAAFAGILRSPRLDGRVLGFLAAVTLLTGVISGLLPAVKAAGGSDLMPAIQEGGQRSGSRSGRRSLAALVVVEMAIAVTLLAGGALMIQSFRQLQRVELGFRPAHLLTMHLELQPAKYQEFPRRVIFVEQVLQRIRELPGVEAAGTTTNVPLSSLTTQDSLFTVAGHPPANPADLPISAHRLVSPGYLETLGVTLVKGRLLGEQDRAGGLPVAVITEELARQGWRGEDPIGKQIKRVRPGQPDFPWLTVVGVVRDVKEDRFNFRVDRPVWYLPYAQQENTFALDLMVRTAGDPASLTQAIRRAVLAVDREQPVSDVTTMDALLSGMLATERFSAILMGALAAMGLALAVIGLYGVMAYSVRRQTGEIGLRVALGASPGAIFGMVLGRGAKLIGVGLLIGVSCAAALARLLAGTLYGVGASDPATFAIVALLAAAVAAAACILPARRAMRVDPLVALRSE
jgi:putative ABC transport system permease protein